MCMSSLPIPFRLPGFHITDVQARGAALTIWAHATMPSACCPRCQQPSRRVHSYYLRAPRDLPISDLSVHLRLRVRRFRCLVSACGQRTFAERIPAVVPVAARRTARLTATLQTLAFTAGGEAGARASTALHMSISPDTLLRITRRAACGSSPTPRVLGVDDFAFRKGRDYGTILVDLERQRPVDLLPDRTADTLRAWLQQHPGVTIIARDRSTEYARGATAGAPHAQQIADRWHLLKNLRDVVERVLNRRHVALRQLPVRVPSAPPSAPSPSGLDAPGVLRTPSASERVTSAVARERRLAQYTAVRMLSDQGLNILQIARRLGISRTTVRRYRQAAVFPERGRWRNAPSILDPYRDYLARRWAAGCQNASHLWREIQALGFPGTRKQVERWAQRHRQEPAPSTPNIYRNGVRERQAAPAQALATPRQLAWLLVRKPDALTPADAATVATITKDPEVALSYTLAQQFLVMVRERMPQAFDPWLDACTTSNVGELRTFAIGLQQDHSAVVAALAEPWSTGPVEGHINRLKLVKRQMFGRANFDLLKQRVLHAA